MSHDREYLSCRDTMPPQIAGNRPGPLLRNGNVLILGTGVIGMPLNSHSHVRMGLEVVRHPVQPRITQINPDAADTLLTLRKLG